jgi:hypothetical protein
MPNRRTILLIVSLLAIVVVSSVPSALADTPSFTITATPVTKSSTTSSGQGSTTFTLSSVNGYAGTVDIYCGAQTLPAGVNVPICNFGGPAVVVIEALTANQVVTGSILFLNVHPPCNPCPVSLPRRGGHGLTAGLALAGALLFGLGFRRRAPRWLTLSLLAVGALSGLVGISARADNSVVTPGTYAYSIKASDQNTNASVTTTINVTVP